MPGEYSSAAWSAAIAQITATVVNTAQGWATDVQQTMRSNAPWSDRGGRDSVTGLTARQSLETEVGVAPDGSYVQIVARSTRENNRAWRGFGHAPVGAFLEMGTRKMARRDVIRPTLDAMTPDLSNRLTTAFNS